MKCEALYSDDRKCRYLLKKEWDSKADKAMILMLNPSNAGVIVTDFTTLYIQNNLYPLGFGSIDIVNVFPNISKKLSYASFDKPSLDEANKQQILKSAESAHIIILAWGKKEQEKLRYLQLLILSLLEPYQDKIRVIASDQGESGFHPLAPQIRQHWNLLPVNWKELCQHYHKQTSTPAQAIKKV